MRNLKRALSLALASVMLVGMMVVGTSASYEDVSSDYNQEAIEVLQAIDVMVGDEDGNFNPDAAVTRNEMAVIMSNLMDYRVATYAGTSPFTDVPAWAEPYVAACYTNGITAGIGNNLYGGSKTVTTAEAALMMMKALGYFQYASDFGEDWQLATTKQAGKIDLLDDVDSGVKEAMTRNDVAQLVLNTLKAGIVEADDSNVVKVDTGDVKVDIGGTNYVYVTSGKDYASAIIDDASDRYVDATGISTGFNIVQLGEKLYQGDLKLDDDEQDNFGRPAVTWTYGVNEIGTYADDAIATYTAKVTRGDLYSLIGSSNVSKLAFANIDKNELTVFVDGDEITTFAESDIFQRNSTAAIGDVLYPTEGAKADGVIGVSGKGVLTEVYQDGDNNVTIVIVNTYLAQAITDYNKDKDDVSITPITAPSGIVIDATLEGDDFDITDYAQDDYILYTYSRETGEIESIAPAKVVTGEVNSYAEEDYVKIDGTQYDYALTHELADTFSDTFVVADTASIVLDAYGYVIYVDDASISVGSYVYIDGLCYKSGLSGNIIADAYFSDGTNEEITIKSLVDADGNSLYAADGEGGTVNPGTTKAGTTGYTPAWFSFVKASDGKYKLTQAETSASLNINDFENGKAVLTNGVTGVAGNSDTIFLLDDGDDIDVYTGIANLPDITTTPADSGIPIVYMRNKDQAGKAAILVYVDVRNADVDDSNDSLLYVLKLNETGKDKADGETYREYTVIIDGTVTSVRTKETWNLGDFYERYSIDSDGYYESGRVFRGNGQADKGIITFAANSTLSYSKGTLTVWDGAQYTYIILDDTQIVTVLHPAIGTNTNDLKHDIMKDAAAKYEVRTELNGSALASLFTNHTIEEGNIYVTYADDNLNLATVLYIVVSEVDRT